MNDNENTQKRPLLEALDESIRNVMQTAKLEDRTINQAQYEILEWVYESLSDIIGKRGRITLHPAFSSGGILIVTEDVNLNCEEVSKLKAVLAECSTLSVEPLTNGNIEIGVTVPGVFYPLDP